MTQSPLFFLRLLRECPTSLVKPWVRSCDRAFGSLSDPQLSQDCSIDSLYRGLRIRTAGTCQGIHGTVQVGFSSPFYKQS